MAHPPGEVYPRPTTTALSGSSVDTRPAFGDSGAAWTVILASAIYSGSFIYYTSFVVDGIRHFSLFDDAMISMRYAKNLAAGYGLVWNPGGERVEGYTNPLWVLYMAVLHWLPVPASKISLLVQVTGLILLLINLCLVRKIARAISDDPLPVSLGAMVLTAFYLPLVNWSVQGMEVGLLTCLTSWTVWLVLRSLQTGQFSAWPYVVLGLATLVRLDMVVAFVAITGFLLFKDPANRHLHLVLGGAILGTSLVIQTGFRLWYFEDPLPNTYYLKMTGYPIVLRVTRGLYVLSKFVAQMGFALFLLPVVALAIRRDIAARLLLCVLSGQLLYSVYVGGDAWEEWGGSNRYISLAMPLFFILLARALFDVGGLVRHSARLTRLRIPVYGALLLSSLLSLNCIYGAEALGEWALRTRPMHAVTNHGHVELAYVVQRVTRPDATVAVTMAGVFPYFANRVAIDLLGKADGHVARLPMKTFHGLRSLIWFLPGHLKWDFAHSIGKLRPDVVLPMGELTKDAEEFMRDYRRVTIGASVLYLLETSETVLWSEIDKSPGT